MALSVGIVGLPNVGKSTLFNALTRAQNAQAANYPFCTIEPNKAVVPVPDVRLAALAELVKPQKIVPATVDFYDIAGLVKGASQGEGLGNKFLAHIRETGVILHVVRCFDDPDVVHVDGSVNPVRDVEIIEAELLIADAQVVENRVERLRKMAKFDKDAAAKLKAAETLLAHLLAGNPASTAPGDGQMAEVLAELRPLTAKPIIYCANVDEAGLSEDNDYVKALQSLAESKNAHVLTVSAKVEEELGALADDERDEFLASYGVAESGLNQVIRAGYAALGLISYFTAGPKEVKAWTIEQGWKAPKAASVIHTDFERGFIRAEAYHCEDLFALGSEQAVKANGLYRSEGKEYVVRDGDILFFKFNV